MSRLEVGTLVRPSHQGLQQVFQWARKKRALGTIVGISDFPDCYVIKWDDLRTKETLHRDFIEPSVTA